VASSDGKGGSFDSLKLPSMRIGPVLRSFGPGLILMMTGIGTSHMVTAPVAGGRFEYALLWAIPAAYIFKYYGFETAFRFTHATGRSLLDAYATAWRSWPLWYVLVTTLVQCVVGQAGRLIAASAVLYYPFKEYLGVDLPLVAYAAPLAVISVVVLLTSKYAVLELFTKVLAGILLLSAIAVYVVEPAPLSGLGAVFRPEAPAGSWLVLAAFLGLLPTGIDVSLQASEWGKAKKVGLGRLRNELERNGIAPSFDPRRSPKEELAVDLAQLPEHAQEYCRRWFKIALWDFRLGHVVSFFLATLFLLLAAVWLYPSDVEGNAVMGEIARMFTDSVGPQMMLIFLLGAFAATFSTAFNYFDGWPRVVAACCRNLFAETSRLSGIAREDLGSEHRRKWSSEFNLYRGTMLFSMVAAVAITAGVPKPVWLVLVASALAFFIAPVIYLLNLYYCFTVIPRDSPFYPSRFAAWFGWGSLVVFTGMTAILILARLFGIELIGG